jgi:hypothetical protein
MNTLNSNLEILRGRGYIENYDLRKFQELDRDELIKLLYDIVPVHRSAAAKVIGLKYGAGEEKIADILLEQLYKEKKLYTRLEICTALESGNSITAKRMIPYIGRIGNNQHRVLPDRPSLKKSYPLPRDLIVRSLARMKREIMPVLMEVLDSNDTDKIREVLDAIGFLAFYNIEAASVQYMEKVIDTVEKHKEDDIITWKGIICLSAFPYVKSKEFLKNLSENSKINIFAEEAGRALKVMR